ncbi:MAG: AFG1 family ATPase [Gammaproteobacteria bacterium]|nr:AFG1 family ATPase [Gammaproteobacteria bacterium]
MSRPLAAAYDRALAAHGYQADAAQRNAVAKLDELAARLSAAHAAPGGMVARLLGLFGRRQPSAPERGLYLWGGVGRGKTFLMDLFYESLPFAAKRRSHFHRFMRDVHASLREVGETEDPLEQVAATIAAEARVLCFDELHVSDIADAMILGALFDALFRRGVTLVATSNLPPSGLYRDGLQRARFLPAIALLERHAEVVEVDAGQDYRLRELERAPLYVSTKTYDSESRLQQRFTAIAGDPGTADVVLMINDRPIAARRHATGVAWFTFPALCEGPRGAADYIEIARCYHTVLVSDVPVFDAARENEARRFIALVDEAYDRGVKLVVSAEAPPVGLYRGERLGFEFQRTVSRLTEMQSHDYLARPHRP